MKKDLSGKTIVITGASSGAGRAAALEFAKYNTRLVLAARNNAALESVALKCRDLGSEARIVVTDVSDPTAVQQLARAAWDGDGRLDVWINNAGVLAAGPFEDTPLDIHRQVIQTNLLGYIHGAHAVLPIFKQQKQGILINNISIGGFLPVPYGAAYTASKFGLRGFFEALRGELTRWPDIHICDLFPAFLHTPGMQHAANYTGKLLKAAPPTYSPQKLAHAMVKTAIRPRATRYIGAVAPLFRLGHALLPQTVTDITGMVMRRYFVGATPSPNTSGNVKETVNEHMQMTGRKEEEKQNRAVNLLTGAILTSGVIALAAAARRRTR